MSRRFEPQDATGILEAIRNRGIFSKFDTVAPTAGAAGFAPACFFRNVSAAPYLYVNVGSNTSASWFALDSEGLTINRAEINTADTTVNGTTLTAAAIVGGVITRSGSTAAYTDTTATATLIVAGLPAGTPVNASWELRIRNTVAFAETLLGGTGVTLSGNTIIPPNSTGLFLVTYTGATTVTILGIGDYPLTTTVLEANTALTTAGAGTLLGAALAGGVITRTGPTTDYTDTTDTATLIIAALPNANIGQSWEVTIKNTVAFNQTLAGGTGVTLSGQTIIPPNSVGRFLLTYSAATTVTMQGLSIVPMTTNPLEVNTAITTVGNGTLTAAGITGGVITRSGSTGIYTDTTATATLIFAALPNANIGQSFEFSIKNTVGFNETIAAGTGITLAGQTIIPPNSVGRFLCVFTSATAATITGLAMVPMTTKPLEVNTADITVNNATLTAASIVGGLITRSGSTADYVDTTATAALIIAALPNANVGDSFEFSIKNTVAFNETIAAGATVTLAGITIVPPNSVGKFLCVLTSATAVTITGIGSSPIGNIPDAKFTTVSIATATFSAGDITGARFVNLTDTNATPGTLTTRTATQMFGDVPNAQVGGTYLLRITNNGGTTITLAAGTGVTLTGTATILINAWRDFVVTFNTSTTMTFQNIGTGTFS